MRIFIDGDGSPVIKETEIIAKQYGLDLIIVADKSHLLRSNYAQLIQVDPSTDGADFFIFSQLKPGDILVSQDLGLCAMALAKQVYCINQDGQLIDNQNIDFLLQNRHVASKLRREKKIYTRQKKRSPNQDLNFMEELKKLIGSLGPL